MAVTLMEGSCYLLEMHGVIKMLLLYLLLGLWRTALPWLCLDVKSITLVSIGTAEKSNSYLRTSTPTAHCPPLSIHLLPYSSTTFTHGRRADGAWFICCCARAGGTSATTGAARRGSRDTACPST